MSAIAYRVQLACPLSQCEAVQTYLDISQPNVWAFYPEPGAVMAEVADPTVPAWAVASGRVTSQEYAALAAGAAALELSHMPIAHWEIQGGIEVEVPIENPSSLFDAMGLTVVQDEEEEED
jgi:hypothetical protein